MFAHSSIANRATALLLFGVLGSGYLVGCDSEEASSEQWMSIAPVQCGGNAWEVEEKTLEAYLEDQGVEVLDKRTTVFADAVCLACSCPTGERIDVLVSVNDVPTLLAEGFFREDDWPF